MMMNVPSDILTKIEELFPVNENRIQAIEMISGLWKQELNVGPAQLARSILVVTEGNIEKIKEILDSNFHGDPRDILMAAEYKAGNPGHYFTSSF